MNRNKGNKRNLSIFIDDFTDAMAEVLHRKEYRELVTFDEIVHYAMEEKKKELSLRQSLRRSNITDNIQSGK